MSSRSSSRSSHHQRRYHNNNNHNNHNGQFLTLSFRTMPMVFLLFSLLLLEVFVSPSLAFSLVTTTTRQRTRPSTVRGWVLWQSSTNNSDDNDTNTTPEPPPPPPPPSLILGADSLQQEMGQLKSKYPTSEAAYLAAARARAAAQVPSLERQATDEDWHKARQEKQRLLGDIQDDDWEASLQDSGSRSDSQVLFLLDDDNQVDEDGEPKLLL